MLTLVLYRLAYSLEKSTLAVPKVYNVKKKEEERNGNRLGEKELKNLRYIMSVWG